MEFRRPLWGYFSLLAHLLTLIVSSSCTPLIRDASSSQTFAQTSNIIRLSPDGKGRQTDHLMDGSFRHSKGNTGSGRGLLALRTPPEDALSPRTLDFLGYEPGPASLENRLAGSGPESEELEGVRRQRRAVGRKETTTGAREAQLLLEGPRENANIINAPLFRSNTYPVTRGCPPGTQLSHSGRCRPLFG